MNKRYVCSSIIGLILFLGFSVEGQAQHKGISFQAVMKRSDGSSPTVSGVTVTAQILDPQNHCVLREEEHSSKNISNGYLNLVLGDSAAATPTARNPAPVLSLSEVLNNKVTRTSLKCVDQANNITTSSGSYTPSNIDRRILRIRLNVQGEDIVADFNMRAVGFAVNSEMLNSKTDDDFVNINNAKGVTKSNVESVFDRFTKLDAILNGFNAGGTSAGINISGNASTATTATSVSGTVDIANGGTGATTAAGARTNLGLGSLATMSPTGADGTKFLRDDGTWQTVSGGGGAVSSVAGKTGAVTLSASDVSGLESLATKVTSGTANNTTYLRGDGEWTALGGAASLNIGTGAGTVAAGNDSRITHAIQNSGTDNDTNIVSMSAGLDTNKPGTPVVGQMFVATDAQKIYRYNGSAWVTMAQVGGSGTLASVGLSLPSIFSVTGTPLTADGSISATLVSQNQSHVLAAPNGSNGTPDFRQLQVSDLSNAKSAALYDVPVTGDAGMNEVVKGDDSRLMNARSPIDGSVTSAKIASGAVTDAKIDTVSGSKITGTVPTGTLPVAGSGVAGIVSAIAQSFSGLKTFLNGLAVTGNISASGNITGADLASTGSISSAGDMNATGAVNADRIKVANSSATCNGTIEGSLKYNSTSKKMEYCNGTSWMNISSGVLASLSIGSPSSSLVKSGPVTFDVTYGSGVDTATINLSSGNITIGGTATTGCAVSSVTGSGLTRTVTLNSCSGTGNVNISVAANTAKSTTGEDAPAAGPSTSYNVDNTGPTAPSSVTLGAVPANLTNSPTITYTAASDVGGSTVANHQVQIIRTSDSNVIKAWANHTSGSDVGSLTLATNTQYSVLVRALDALGNIGTSSTAVNWTSINDPCLGSPSPGQVCTGGAIYLGSLSPGATSGSGTNKYMTTPGGCGEIPAGQIVGSSYAAYPSADFTPTCSGGTDTLTKYWNDGTSNWYDIPGLTNYTSTAGTGYGASNTDQYYGSDNTTNIVAITSAGLGGYHAAARYCDKLVYGGYSDWYLPNRYELNLMWTNQASIPGLDKTGTWYWSSTEYTHGTSWFQRFNDGYQNTTVKTSNSLVRCVRRF